MLKKVKSNPFYDGLLKDVKRKVRNAENRANKRDDPNAQRELFEARKELSNLLSQLRYQGYDV